MLTIGEFSGLSHLTVKALRFYEKQGLLKPALVNTENSYRYYETSQLVTAARIKSLRQLGLSVAEIKAIFSGDDLRRILEEKQKTLRAEKRALESRLSIIHSILEDEEMNYRVTEKQIPEMTVYTAETVLKTLADRMTWIPSVGEECLRLNPGLQCAQPPYEFCEYPDGEYKETDLRIRHIEAVTGMGNESERIRFGILPAAKVLSVYHKGGYDKLGEAYAFLMNYAETNSYQAAGLARECYIDGIWNKESEDDWLTEIQLPVKA